MRLKTSDNETGYLNVLKQKDAGRKKPYYAKFLPPGERKQRTLPGSSSETAWEAAAKLAFHLEAQLELPAKEIRGLRRPNEVSCLSLPSPFERSVFSPCGSCVQECRLERLENAAKKQASVARKLAATNAENVPVQPVFFVQTGLMGAPVCAAMPLGSPMPMQPIASPMQLIPVMLGPGGL